MQKKLTNYAFIDSQNLNLGVRRCGWVLDFKRFRVFLKEKHAVNIAYIFIGYIPANQPLYTFLQHCGYTLIFKEVVHQEGKPKGNVDAELVLQAMIDFDRYQRAIIVTGDGDFACLVRHLNSHDKLERVLAPNQAKCSHLLHKAAAGRIAFVEDMRAKLEYKEGK